MDRKRFRPWECAALAALCLVLLSGLWAQARQRALAAQVLRLHITAVSDEPAEQALKLRVRDAVLAALTPVLADVSDVDEAKSLLAGYLPQVQAAAESAAEGRAVRVTLGRERFPLRAYAAYTLPAGEYDALRVTLGAGQGHNWWCVVFPTLCLSDAGGEQMQSVLAPEDYALVSGEEGYELRFRVVELWEELLAALS